METVTQTAEETQTLPENTVIEISGPYGTPDKETSEFNGKLLKKLMWLKKMLVSNPVVPILDNFLFDKGAIFASDLQNTAMVYTDIKGSFLVPAKELISYLKPFDKADKISFSTQDDLHLEINVNGVKFFTVPMEHISDYPKQMKCEVTVAEFANKNDFEQMAIASQYTSNDALRPAMQCVYVNENSIVATDGHKLVKKLVKDLIIHEPGYFMMISKRAITMMAGFNHATVKRNTDNTWLTFKETDRAVMFRNIDERFPNYENVIPFAVDQKIHATINRKVMEKHITLAIAAANKTTNQVAISFHNNENAMGIYSEDLDFSTQYETAIDIESFVWEPSEQKKAVQIMTMSDGVKLSQKTFDEYEGTATLVSRETVEVNTTVTPEHGKAFSIGFNGKFLLQIIKSIETENLVFDMQAPNRAVMINNEFLLMPVMLNQYV